MMASCTCPMQHVFNKLSGLPDADDADDPQGQAEKERSGRGSGVVSLEWIW